ncbi:MAG: nickel pincer cofactor biosynthesis protein LarB [Pseudohongiellaceae bacterium]
MNNEINLDWDRAKRTGLSEAILCLGKSLANLQQILGMAETRNTALLFTRLEATIAGKLFINAGVFDYDPVSRTAYYLPAQYNKPELGAKVAVVSAGSADLPVAKEVVRTLTFYGIAATEIYDIGVAGLWRMQEKLETLRAQQVLVCVAGMDAALPTVLAGLISSPVIAVPVSTGYGMAKNGETALNALLCSCAQGLVVVNIDNGFGAACAVLRVLSV